jgi:hypothetical protein
MNVICRHDLKKSQHNRPHHFVKHLSKKHDITVLSINDWWKGGQGDMSGEKIRKKITSP